jgi:hypothetical protein
MDGGGWGGIATSIPTVRIFTPGSQGLTPPPYHLSFLPGLGPMDRDEEDSVVFRLIPESQGQKAAARLSVWRPATI